MKNLWLTWLSLILIVSFSACSYRVDKQLNDALLTNGSGGVGFSQVYQRIFQPRCVSCHGSSGGVNLENYAQVRLALPRIQSALQLKAMPPSGPLRNAESDFVLAWISDGAPEFAQGSIISPTPQVSSEPIGQPSGEPSDVPTAFPSGASMGYKTVYQSVFRVHCLSCHGTSGGVSLADYPSTLAAISKIKTMIESNQMPPRKPLPAEKRQLLLDWIQAGAPENAVGPSPNPEPTPEPSPEQSNDPADQPLVPTYRSIHAHLFTPKCIGCHDGESGAMNLDSLAWIRSSKIIDPDRPEKSEIVKVLRRGRMPPMQSGQGPLSSEQVNVIETWIRSGLPE